MTATSNQLPQTTGFQTISATVVTIWQFGAVHIHTFLELIVLMAVFYHIWHFSRTTKELNVAITEKVQQLDRHGLIQALVSTATDAKQSIIHYTYTFRLPDGPDSELEMKNLLNAIEHTKLNKNNIRFLGPDYTEKLDRLYSRRKVGATLKVSQIVKNSDLRFQVTDNTHIVITVGEPGKESRHGYLIDSVILGAILTEWFDKQWATSEDYESFVRKQVITASNIHECYLLDRVQKIDFISNCLGLDKSEVSRLLEPPPQPSVSNDTPKDGDDRPAAILNPKDA